MDGALTYQDIQDIKTLKMIREPRNTVGVLERITQRLILFHKEIVHLHTTKQIMMRGMKQYLKVRFTSKMEFQLTKEQKHRIFMNLPQGNFEAQDNDDYEEIDDDMLDEGSDVEDPNF